MAEKYNLHLNAIYKWKKQMFETAPLSLSQSKKLNDRSHQKAEQRIAELEVLLAKREALFAELVEDNIYLKKRQVGNS